MQLLRLALILLFSTQLLNAEESEPIEVSGKNHYTRNQGIDGFKAALRSLSIDPEVREIERMLANYSGTEDKRDFLKKLIMSDEGIKQFQKNNGRKPADFEIESAYEVLISHCETVVKKVYVATDNQTIDGVLRTKVNNEVVSQLLHSMSNRSKKPASDDLIHGHRHTHNHEHHHSDKNDGLSDAHTCSHNHGSHHHHSDKNDGLASAHTCSHNHGSREHHNHHHHNHSSGSHSVDVIGCACSDCG